MTQHTCQSAESLSWSGGLPELEIVGKQSISHVQLLANSLCIEFLSGSVTSIYLLAHCSIWTKN